MSSFAKFFNFGSRTLVLLLSGLSLQATDLPVHVGPTDPNLRYVGRFDISESGARCAWSASQVDVKFNGTDANVELSEKGKDFWQVAIDGAPTAVLQLKPGKQDYSIATGLVPGEHILSLTKRTEASVGITTLLGFQFEQGAELLPMPAPSPVRKIEIIGDSITCGYGNEAASKLEHFSPATENITLTYGALAAREVGADYMCIAWSGRKLWPDISIMQFYDAVLPLTSARPWDFSKWIADVVVINLGANDFANRKANPDRTGWINAYEELIARLRKQYPGAVIYCAVNPLTTDKWPPGHQALTTLRSYLTQIVDDLNKSGDTKVHLLTFEHEKPEDGTGADGHPSLKTHQIMADKLLEALAIDPGWK